MLLYGILDGLGDGLANFIRSFFWGVNKILMTFIESLTTALIDGVLGFGVLQNEYVIQGYKACFVLFFIILPTKLIWETLYAMVRDDDIDIGKKIMGAVIGVILAASLPTLMTMANTLQVNVSKALVNGNNTNYGNEIIVATFTGFGGMDRNNVLFKNGSNADTNAGMDIGAEQFIKLVMGDESVMEEYAGDPSENDGVRDTNSFEGNERWELYDVWDDTDTMTQDDGDLWGDTSGDGTNFSNLSEETINARKTFIENHDNEYVWDFSYLGVLVGLTIFVILLFFITTEVATRVLMMGILFVIGPLCCMSLTNYQNPQAFTVWKNTILGNWFTNIGQIFALMFFCNLTGDIAKVNLSSNPGATTITQLALYLASFSLVITLPAYIRAMLGGYGAGIMETLQQTKGVFSTVKSLTWGATGGAAMTAGRKVFGRHNDNTGHLTGGIRGKLFGNKHGEGTGPDGKGRRVGGAIPNAKKMGAWVRDKAGGRNNRSNDENSGTRENRSGNGNSNYSNNSNRKSGKQSSNSGSSSTNSRAKQRNQQFNNQRRRGGS